MNRGFFSQFEKLLQIFRIALNRDRESNTWRLLKSFVVVLVLSGAALFFITIFSHQTNVEDARLNIEKEMSAIARTTAASIDKEVFEQLFIPSAGIVTNESDYRNFMKKASQEADFRELRLTLRNAINAHRDLGFTEENIYVFAVDALQPEDQLRWAVMAHNPPFVGEAHRMPPEIQSILSGIPGGQIRESSTSPITRQHWIAAEAPLRNARGRIIGFVEVAWDARDVLAETEREVLRNIFVLVWNALLGIAVLLILIFMLFKLAESNRNLKKEILKHKETADKLKSAKTTAETANQTKSEFLAVISHEIRTPLNAIIGMSELVLDTKLTKEQHDYLSAVKSSSDLLLTLMNDILDFSKIESGQLKLDLKEFDLRKCLTDVHKSFFVRSSQKDLTFVSDYDLNAVPAYVIGDDHRLRQIFINLLGNAIKFTNQGGVRMEIKKQWEKEDYLMLQFSVYDTGVGIPPNKQRIIFEMFSQVDSSNRRQYGGTGLGLSIAHKLVQMMGGRIWVESPNPIDGTLDENPGSVFHFTVCFKKSGKKAPKIKVKTRPEVEEHAKQLKVLLAEDNPVNQKMIARILEKMGYGVSLACNGKEAINKWQKDYHDIILMDIQMPEMDGFEATATIREYEKQSGVHVPIIAVTANVMNGDREKCIEAGMDEYVPKPISKKKLIQAIEGVISNE